jgi:hypothetical protein
MTGCLPKKMNNLYRLTMTCKVDREGKLLEETHHNPAVHADRRMSKTRSIMRTIDIRKSRLSGPIVVVIILGLLYWLDNFQNTFRRQAIQTFDMRSFIYFSGVLLILFAILIIFLTWFLLVYSRSSWLTSIFCLLTGTFILGLLFSNFSANPVLRSILNIDPLARFLYVILRRGFESMTLQAGAFVLVIGLVGLVCKIREKTVSN